MDKNSAIFKPIKIGPITVKNRVEVAPACPFLADHARGFSIELREYVRSLARSGAGIVNTGITSCSPPGPEEPLGMRTMIATPFYAADYNDFAEICHRYGAKASLEIVYRGKPPGEVVNFSADELQGVYQEYAKAASMAVEKGFDIICIAGHHSSLPVVFLNKQHNKRTDEYGGAVENRSRFSIEMVEAIREAVGDKAAISYRISAEDMLPGWTTLEETIEFCKAIQHKVDLISVSRGSFASDELLPHLNAPPYFPRAVNLPFAKQIKAAISTPVTVVNAMDLKLGDEAIERGDVDMVSMVRTIFADTDCVNKARKGRSDEIRPCVRCNNCIGRTHGPTFNPVRCAVNPVLGRETHFPPIRHADARRKVVVIGGGPGGMEAARTASALGHDVTLFEKENELGGDLIYASAAEFKDDMRAYLDWSVRMIERDDNIKVMLSVEATPELVKAQAPDVVFVAVGAEPVIPAFTATGTPKLAWVGDVEMGRAAAGGNVLVVGAGFTGLEAGLALARKGKKVKIIDMLPDEAVGRDGVLISMIGLRQELRKENVEIECNLRLLDVDESGAIVESTLDGAKKTIAADTVVLSLGTKADEKKVLAFDDICEDVMYIGDCATDGGTLYKTIHSAFDAAMSIC